jgi:tRNA 2-selenouridine synthase SelU
MRQKNVVSQMMRGVTSQYRDMYLEKMRDERVARGTDEVQIKSKKVERLSVYQC